LILTPFLLQKIKIHKILGIYPTIMIFAFIVFGAVPILQIVLAGIILQRSGAYGLMKPPTDWLFTGLDKNIKYKFKNFMDTVIYRGGDVFTQVVFINAVGYFTKSLRVFAVFGVIFSLIWLVNAITVGRLAHQAFDTIKSN
jgi:AAA family ATP:ADP antiporter